MYSFLNFEFGTRWLIDAMSTLPKSRWKISKIFRLTDKLSDISEWTWPPFSWIASISDESIGYKYSAVNLCTGISLTTNGGAPNEGLIIIATIREAAQSGRFKACPKVNLPWKL